MEYMDTFPAEVGTSGPTYPLSKQNGPSEPIFMEASSSSFVNGEVSSVESNGDIKNGHSEKKHKDKRHKDKHKDKKHKHHKHDKDKHHSRDKDKKSSSSDRHKSERSVSPQKIKDEPSSPSKSHSHKSKHKDKHRDKDQSEIKEEEKFSPANVKIEVQEGFRESSGDRDSDQDDVPLSQRRQSMNVTPVKKEEESDDEDENDEDDVPLSQRKKVSLSNGKRKMESESEDDIPLSQRKKMKKPKTEPKSKGKRKYESESEYDDESEDDKKKKKPKKSRTSSTTSSRKSTSSNQSSPKKGGRKAKEEEPEEVWEWWKEAPREDGVKWNFLEHKGPVFAPDYEPLPKDVKFRYDKKSVKLSVKTEEVAGFYARFIEHEYSTKETFNRNFFKDWRKVMTVSEKELIKDLSKCDFTEINDYYKKKSEERKAMSKEEKLKLKEENERVAKEYGICILDGHKEKVGNFRIEPPGLFRGRGEHPKMGMLKTRVIPEEVIINCSKGSKTPTPPTGHKWKEVRHDNTVSWLASWIENVQGQPKYVMLNPTSRLKGEKDWMKYEKARELAKKIDEIRENYRADFKSKEMKVRQRAVALYFIDKLALRAGNEKDEDQADTVGCCSLRVEHITLHDKKDGKECVVVFDFLGKDSIRYHNEVAIEKRVFKNVKLFVQNKRAGDDLFDRLNTGILNKHLSELMDGLSAKVFRTYNASHTLQQELDATTPKNGTPAEKLLAYNRANRAVAVLCNHQRAAPKSHEKSMENLEGKIKQKQDDLKDLIKEAKGLKKGSAEYEKKQNARKRLEEQLKKLEMSKTDKEEGKEIALGTSKLNYLDPRITVAWCKKHDVPIEKAYNKTMRAKFRWAIDMADKKYRFD